MIIQPSKTSLPQHRLVEPQKGERKAWGGGKTIHFPNPIINLCPRTQLLQLACRQLQHPHVALLRRHRPLHHIDLPLRRFRLRLDFLHQLPGEGPRISSIWRGRVETETNNTRGWSLGDGGECIPSVVLRLELTLWGGLLLGGGMVVGCV